MSVTQNIGADKKWFIGEDKILEFEPLMDDGKAIDDATKGVEDVSTWALAFWLSKKVTDETPIFEKRVGTGISVVGIYNASRASNTQRIRVVIEDTDTESATFVLKAGTYPYAVKRILAGGDAILVDGTAVLQKAAAPKE